MLLTYWQNYSYFKKIIRRKDYIKGRKSECNNQTTSKERERKKVKRKEARKQNKQALYKFTTKLAPLLQL